MSAVQGKFSLFIVIEQPQLKSNRVVAGFATRMEIAFVWIVIKMTGFALRIGFRKCLRLVAVFALVLRVFSTERKIGEVMIKEDRVFPDNLRMTIFALRA